MASSFGKNIKVSLFGQSHSAAIGVVIDGLPAGQRIDMEEVARFMARRAPGRASYSTPRKEDDKPVILSGLVDDKTCGAPLCATIANTNTRSADYDNLRDVPRPGHADYTAHIKYGGHQDVSGGGHFSGRLTAPLCFAGAVCMQILARQGIHVGAHIHAIGGIPDAPVSTLEQLRETAANPFPAFDALAAQRMKDLIEQCRMEQDSVGGVVECMAFGLPAGLGEPMFDGVENRLSAAVFGIPAVKGIEFGEGFGASLLRGSQNNDPFFVDEQGQIRTKTNRHGGILGGITSGMPIVMRVAFKPTPSISQEQRSVSLSQKADETLVVKGRHDPCIVPRAVPVVEAVTAITILDLYLQQYPL